jgi:methylase of polypeptide subunit release factors
MNLNQYYTQQYFGDVLVKHLNHQSPIVAMDLGFGEGELLKAAKRRWENLHLVGVDIDARNVTNACRQADIKAMHGDGFNPDLPARITEKYGDIDILVSNPPYFATDINRNVLSILKESGLSECISKKSKKVPAELVFLAQNLRLLRTRGELGIILPAGLICGENWLILREYLYSEYTIKDCIQLPVGAFCKTDAQTFILILSKKQKNDSSKVNLAHLDFNKNLTIKYSDAIKRSDFIFHNRQINEIKRKTIDKNSFIIKRGYTSHKSLKNQAIDYIHTTNFPSEPEIINIANVPQQEYLNAQSGDIIVARVGSRCIGRVAYIESGQLPVSDCIIIIRPMSAQIGSQIWSMMRQKKCKLDLTELSLGVGAKYLTHKIVKDYILNV